MNQKEQSVSRCKYDVHIAETKLVDAEEKLRLKTSELALSMELEISILKSEIARAQINLQKERSYLKLAESDLERGFDA